MNKRILLAVGVLVGTFVVVGLRTSPTVQAQEEETYVVSRTPWGHPDLQGSWENRTPTPLERDPQYGNREWLTEEEAAQRAETRGGLPDGDEGAIAADLAAADVRRFERADILRVSHGANGGHRLLRGLDGRKDDAVRTRVKDLLDHPGVLFELAARRWNPDDDGLGRLDVTRPRDRAGVQEPLHPRAQRGYVEGAMLHVVEDEINIAVCRESDRVCACINREPKGNLVVVEQANEAVQIRYLRVLLPVHTNRGDCNHRADHNESEKREDGPHVPPCLKWGLVPDGTRKYDLAGRVNRNLASEPDDIKTNEVCQV